MTVFTLKDSGQNHVDVDGTVCIIGAGIAGLFAGRRLAALGHRVVILESGFKNFDQAIHDLNKVENPSGQFNQTSFGRYRGLGGSSPQWGGRLIPLTAHDAGPREYVGIKGWPFDIPEMDCYRKEIESVFQIDQEPFEEEILAQLDPKGRIRRNDKDFTLRYPKWPTFTHCNLVNQFHHEIYKWENLEIWLGATVGDFELDTANGTLKVVTGRDFAGRTIKVSARHFLFAAGAVEVTRLLLQLDEASNGRAFEKCDALGRYFNDHFGAEVGKLDVKDRATMIRWFGYYFIGSTRRNLHIEMTPAVQEEERVTSVFGQVFLNPAEKTGLNVVKNVLRGLQRGVLDMHPRDLLYLMKDSVPMMLTGYWKFFRSQLYIPSSVPLTLNIWAEQAPRRDNRIVLSENRDPLGNRMARVEWTSNQDDEHTFHACAKRLGGYWERSGLAQACPVIWSDAVKDPDGIIAGKAEDCGHPSGSTRLGIDPAQSVVDTGLFCHHVPNVSVASASVFPAMGSANPTYTIIQVALRAADKLAARL